MDRFSSVFPKPYWMTWKFLAKNWYNYPKSHPKVYSDPSNSQPLHYRNFPVRLNWTFREQLVFPDWLLRIQKETQSWRALRYHWFPAHIRSQDVSCATHTAVVSSFLEFFSFWTVMTRAMFDAHRHWSVWMFSSPVHPVTRSVAKCMCLPWPGNLFSSYWSIAADYPCSLACTSATISTRYLCVWQAHHSMRVFLPFQYQLSFRQVALRNHPYVCRNGCTWGFCYE